MKKAYLLLILIFSFGALPVGVFAQGEDQTDPVRLEREKRISERKSRVKVVIDDAQKKKLSGSCTGGQTKLASHLNNAQKFSEHSDTKFNQLVEKITTLIKRLKDNGHDTSGADQTLAKATEQNTLVKTSYEKYISALSDAKAIDCKADPEGFRAAVDEAKAAFAELVKARVELKKIVKEELKTSLRSIVIKS